MVLIALDTLRLSSIVHKERLSENSDEVHGLTAHLGRLFLSIELDIKGKNKQFQEIFNLKKLISREGVTLAGFFTYIYEGSF